jgi:hypothetical protein
MLKRILITWFSSDWDSRRIVTVLVTWLATCNPCYGQLNSIDPDFHHIRNNEPREWTEFAEEAEAKQYAIDFSWHVNQTPATLLLRQYDVKQNWKVMLNDHEVGSLFTDEKEMVVYYSIPPGLLKEKKNSLVIQCTDTTPDDIKVGSILLDERPMKLVLSEATIDFDIVDENGASIPGRITIINADRVLQTIIPHNHEGLAIRPGYVYSGNGKGSITTTAGAFTLYATRGFEYSVDSMKVVLRAGDRISGKFVLKKEVPTEGWVSTDTHLHTYTHSGHGDASDQERVLTIAGEGIELPIVTDHNVAVDLEPIAIAMGVRRYFTPVTGNEVTTKVGHFNIFPSKAGTNVPDHRIENWGQLFQNIKSTEAPVIILNHGRDIHNGFRPFDKERYLPKAGYRLDSNAFFANAMEVINSGSQQSNFMQLYCDWFGLLNRGYHIAPAGSSDSHDVSRFFAGQARTYIKCDDKDPARIDIESAVKNFLAGKVMVSLGLLATLTVNDNYGPGDLVPASDSISISVSVLGPSWIQADKITIYANGIRLIDADIGQSKSAGLKWKRSWKVLLPNHDVYLVAIAEGPAGKIPYWPIAKPYQPASPEWHAKVLGSSGAVWIDADKNRKPTSAYEYAVEVVNRSKGDIQEIVKKLTAYDEAIATQVALLLWKNGQDLRSKKVTNALKSASSATRSGFNTIVEWVDDHF